MTKTETSTRKLILIDGNGLAYRSFYAVPPQKTASGLPTNAVLGFTNLLLNVLLTEKPTHVAVAFDQSASTERLQKFQAYNVQREEMPDELAVQIPLIEDLVRECGLAAWRVRGHEADDCIGTLAAKARDAGFQVLIVSGDLDLLQLVGPRVRVQTTRRGIGDLVVYDEAGVKKKYNLDPCQLADLRALAGDSSQNIGGVPGIGEVTARKLLSQYRSLDDLLSSLDQLPAKWRNPLSENREDALEFRTRATIVTTLDLEPDWDRCEWRGVAVKRLAESLERFEALKEFEFLMRRLEATAQDTPARPQAETLAPEPARAALVEAAEADGALALAWLSVDGQERGLAVARPGTAPFHVALGDGEGEIPAAEAWATLTPALGDPNRPKYVHRSRDLAHRPELASARGVFDVAVASALLDLGEREHGLEQVSRRHDLATACHAELWGLDGRRFADIPVAERGRWTGRRATTLLELGPLLETRLREEGLEELYHSVDLPLAAAFGRLEGALALDPESVTSVARALEEELETLRHEIHAEADRQFNLDCDKELGEFLFEDLGLLVPTRPKNGGAIGADVLVSLVGQHPIAPTVRNYRELSEFKAIFAEGFLSRGRLDAPVNGSLFNPSLMADPRLHWLSPVAAAGTVATFHQMMAVVENLQSLPVRPKLRRLVERTVVAPAGRKLVALEYDQLELRLLAHLSGDSALGEAVRREDLEASLAASFFEVDPSEVELEMKRTVVQLALHAMGPRWLARRLDVSEERAAERLRAFHHSFGQRFPQAAAWFGAQLEGARRNLPLDTLAGRRRRVPEIHSRNYDIREAAERLARGAAVEGSAADVLKAAVVALTGSDLPIRLALQVHNTLVLDVPADVAQALAHQAEGLIARASLGVDLPVRLRVGDSLEDMPVLERETALN